MLKKLRNSALLTLSILFSLVASSQLVSNNAFLKGNYVEVGIAPCGSFGSSVSAPTGYHPRGLGSGSTTSQLGFVANVAKNNWASYVGDYFLPGSPEEGWGLTVNGTSYNNNQICASGSNQIQGNFISHETNSSQVSATWQGNVAGLSITAKTYIPLNSVYFITEVTIQNTSANKIDNIFYMRNVDPDHGVLTPGAGGSYVTTNTIVNQTPNSCNQALVSAVTLSGNNYLGLGSIDSRARVTHGGFSNRSAIDIWNGSGFTTSGTVVGDRAVSVAFNVGSLNANQSTKFAYAYVLDAAQLTQALAATNINLALDGVNFSTGNTSNICSGTAVPINLSNTGTYTTWTWTPATGLNTTSGTSVIATLTSPITYTATGVGTCGSTSVNITLNPVIESAPGSAGSISGLTVIGLGQTSVTYSIPQVSNATYYTWVLPPGAVVTSARNDANTITFNAPSTTWCGNISVQPKNSCGVGTASSLAICISNIATGSVASPLCGGATGNLPISTPLGFFLNGNVFTAQLSDASGSFANPVNIGSVTGTSSSFISYTIPLNTLSGTGYRIRTISSSPATIGTDNGSNLTINAAQTPTIQINANQTTVCTGTPITFIPTITAGGTTPLYQWKLNGVNVSTSNSFTIVSPVAGDQVSCTLTSNATCATSTTAISNTITLLGGTGTPSVSISSNKSVICAGTAVLFTAVAINGGTSPVYQWKKNGVNVGTNSSTYSDNTLLGTDAVTCVLTSNATCISIATATSNSLSVTVNANLTPSVAITASHSSVCSGANVTVVFTATPTNGGTSPTYQWRKNGVNIGDNSNTYSTSTLGGSDIITCVLTSNATCLAVATATSNAISVIITPSVSPSISITASQTAICTGSPVPTIIFTATQTGGGSSPSYQWRKNGINVGTNSATYSDNSFVNGTSITCILTSNDTSPCLTATTDTSEAIVITVSGAVTPFINISTASTTVCSGSSTTFTATILNGGTTPSYQWRKNGVNVGTDIGSYTDNTLVTGDQISCVLTSSAPCTTVPTATSNNINITVSPLVVPSISISASQTIICSGTTPTITFRATPINGGFATYQWRKNGIIVGTTTSTTYTTAAVAGGDVFSVTMNSTANCAVPAIVESNTLTLTAGGTATPTLSISTPVTSICSGNSVTFTAVSTNGGVLPTYQWFRNGLLVQSSSSIGFVISTLVNGDVITCTMSSNLACASPTIVNSSNSITMTVTPSITPSITIAASQTTICTGTSVTFTATAINAGTNPTYQWYRNGVTTGTNSSTYIDNTLTNGSTVYCRITNNTSTCLTGNNVFSNTVTMTVSSGLTPSISISTPTTFVCSGAPVSFTASISNGGTTPTYQWKKNGVNVGTNSNTYTDNTLTSTDAISCMLTSNAGCLLTATATSNSIFLTVTTPVNLSTLTLTSSQSIICTGTTPTVTFTATPANTTVFKYYYWRKNGIIVSSPSSYGAVNYSTSSIVAGDIFTCEIYGSDATCVTPTYPILSNSIQLSSAPSATPSVSIAASTTTSICNGGFVTFVATGVNRGSNPTYQWRKNGIVNVTTSSSTYSFSGLANGDIVTCTMTSNLTCAVGGPVTSNGIAVTVSPIVTPTVSIAASQTNVCAGTNITFTATPTNGGTAPTYVWTKNSVAIPGETSVTYTSNNFATGDIIRCTLTSNASCISTTTANSNTISLVITGSVPSVSISTPSTSLCFGSISSIAFTATPTNGGTLPTYQWKKNGINVGTNSAIYTDNSIANNDTITCALTSDAACPATVVSNKIGMQIITVSAPTVTSSVNTNCGQSILLTATPAGSGDNVRWFASASGGTALATGNSYPVSPLGTTTYYAEAFYNTTGSTVSSINTSGAVGVEASSLAGGVASGIALSPNYVYMTGNSGVARFNRSNLSGGTSLPARTKYFSDLSNGNLWQIGDNSSNGNSFYSGTITRLYRLDENLNATGVFLTLSQSIQVSANYTIMAPGEGYIIIHDYFSGTSRHISLSTGTVTVLTTTLSGLNFNISNDGTNYGWSEYNGTDYFIIYASSNTIFKANLTTRAITTLQSFTNFSTPNVLFSPSNARMYFHHSGSSQFLSGYSTALGYVGVTGAFALQACTSSRIPVTVNVAPFVPTVTASGSTNICSTSSLTLTATAGTAYQWTKDGNNVPGAIAQTYSPTTTGSYAVNVTSSNGCSGVSVATAVTITAPVAPSVLVTANQTTICSGTTITFNATPTNGGTTPVYQWKKNGTNVGTNSITYTDNTLVNGDVITCVLTSNQTCVTSTTATSNSVTLTVSSAVPSVTIAASQTNICSGVMVTFTATAVNGGTAPIYQWKKNGVNVGTNSATYTDNALANNDQVTCVLTSNANCASTTPVASNVISITVTTIATPSISIVASQTTICAGGSITFTATALAGGTLPIYQWKKNGINVGTNSSTFITTALANNDVITCQLTSSLVCVTSAAATSNNITIIVNPTVTPSISINTTQTSVCAGSSVTFTAIATNGGAAPSYQWRKNGVNVGTNSATYTDNALVNGNQITCVLTSNASCVTSSTATSNILTMSVAATVTPSLSIATSTTNICAGSLIFVSVISTVNGGSTPSFQWFKNGINTGFTGTSFNSNSIISGDIITCQLTSSLTCVTSSTVTSNSLTFTVNPSVIPTVSIVASQTTVCAGTTVSLTATASNVGSTPTYAWYRNGSFIFSSSSNVYNTSNITNADYFYCTVTGISVPCATSSVVNSNSITLTIIPQPSISVGTLTPVLCNGSSSATFTAFASNAGITPAYQWKKNGIDVGSNTTTYTDNSLVNNDSVWCILTSSGTCSGSIASAKVGINILTVNDPVVSSPIAIACADTAVLNATVSVGTQVRWFTSATGGTAFAAGNGVKVAPNTNTTYYAEAYPFSSLKTVSSITTSGATIIDHDALTGDDRGGIAISPNYVYVVGDGTTGRYLKSNLTGGQSFSVRDGFFSNIGNGDLWQLSSTSTNGGSFSGGTITQLYKLNENLVPTGTVITLSQPIVMSSGIVAAGDGFVILYTNGSTAYLVSLSNGQVTLLSNTLNLSYTGSESWASYGWGEYDGSNYYIVYRSSGIVKTNASTGVTSTIQTFSNLGDMANIIFDPQTDRMYFHHENSSQFGGSFETLGFVSVTTNNVASNCTSARIPLIVNVSSGVAPTVTASGATSFCSSSSLTLTASTGASYQWIKDGINIVGATSQAYSPTQSGSYSVYVTNSNGCTATSLATNVTVTNPVLPTVSILANQTTICSSTPITFTATATNGGSSPIYQWKKNGNNVGINSATYTDNTLLSGDMVACQLTSNAACITSSSVISNTLNMTVSAAVPSISIAASQTNICSGTSVTFTASAVNGGTAPVYQWKKNGTNVGTNSSSYNDNALVNGDNITCELTSNATCATTALVISNSVPIVVNAVVTPSVSVTASQTTICSGTSITFTAVPFNGGTTPVYQWKRNGINVGSNSNTYITNALVNADVITCQLNSNAICASTASAISNATTITVNPLVVPSVTISTTSTSICTGTGLTFTATAINGGTAPVYQWRKNGVIVGTNSVTYTDNTLANGNSITCTLISNATCASPASIISNSLVITVNSIATPNISISTSNNPACVGNVASFTAFQINGGTSPVFQWKRNGVNVGGNTSTFTSSSLVTGDVITCVMLSNRNCVTTSTATSNAITMTVNPIVTPSISISASTTSICSGSSVIFTATPVNQGSSPSYSWYVNGSFVASTSVPTYTRTLIATASTVYCSMNSSNACSSPSTATSNSISINVIPSVIPTVTVYTPNTSITSGTPVTFTAIPTNGGSGIIYQWKKNGINVGTNSSTYTDNALINADIVSCVITSNAPCASPVTATSNSVTMAVNSSYLVKGNVVNPNNLPIPGATVRVNATDSVYTPVEGTYNFSLGTGGNYNITASKNNDIVKSSGVNVLDVLFVQRHIAGSVLLNSPYKIIAADVDNSGAINIFDLIRTKRLILGIDTTFIGNRLWAFVDSAYTFPDPTNPVAYKDSIKLNSLSSNQINQTFIGVKLGDVNLDLVPTVGINRVARQGIPVKLYHDSVFTTVADKQVKLNIKAKNFNQLIGMQFTLSFNKNLFVFAGVENKALPMEYGIKQANNGVVSFIWSDSINTARTMPDGTVLFTIVLNKIGDIGTESIDINSLITEAIAYDNNYAPHDVLKGESIIIGNKLAVFASDKMDISPNPTTGWVKVKIVSTENKAVTLLLSDMNGKQLMQKRIGLVIGNNEFMLNLNEPKPLPHATYFLKVLGLKGKDVQPIIVGK